MQTDWEKRAQELLPLGLLTERSIRDAALQLGREMANARAEEIAQTCDELAKSCYLGKTGILVLQDAARIARSTISKPKTRERVLEEALREIQIEDANYRDDAKLRRVYDIARRALEWKP